VPAFNYVALDANGKQKKGTLEGDSARQVRAQLREKGLSPLDITPVTEAKASNNQSKAAVVSARSLSSSDLALVTRQLATLIQAGLPVEEVLRAVSVQTEKPKIREMILQIRSKVVEGYTLANSLSEFPKAFPSLYRATVAAGEASGHLDLVLDQLADYTETSHDTAKKVQNALIYPVVLSLFSVLIVVGLLKYVIPKMVSVFENSGQELPLLTQLLISSSEWLQNYGGYAFFVLIALAVLFKKAMEQPRFRFRVHGIWLRLPLIKRFSRGVNSARIANTLNILSRSGVSLIEAMNIASQVTTNDCIRLAVEEAGQSVKEGSSLHKALDKTGFFPPMLIHMIASGEMSGELPEMLSRAARNQNRELESLTTTLVGLFEPLMMVFMGLLILIIVLAIMLPVISLNTLV
jgi:general secretion pathway protein F